MNGPTSMRLAVTTSGVRGVVGRSPKLRDTERPHVLSSLGPGLIRPRRPTRHGSGVSQGSLNIQFLEGWVAFE